MTYDLIENFEKYFENTSMILDSYKLSDGFYYLIKKDGTFEKMTVLKEEADNDELYEYFKIRDFYSKYLNSNKAIDTGYSEIVNTTKYSTLKKICSNNIYTLFFKNKFVLGLCSEQAANDAVPVDIFEKGINKYYDSLKKLGSKKEEKMILDTFYNEKEIEENKQKMLKSFKIVYDDFFNIVEKPKENWIKIFLEEDVQEYKRVANIYLSLKLFNTNGNNKKIDDKLYGVNNYNFGLNSKKTFLELKSTPYKISSLITLKDINILNNMYIWLYNNGIQTSILKLPNDWNFKGIPSEKDQILNKNLFLVKVVENNGNAKIEDFQYVSNYSTNIRLFVCKDYLKSNKIVFRTENIYALQWYINNIWFAGNEKCEKNYLEDSYYDYDDKIAKSKALDNWKKDLLRIYSEDFFEFFQKENIQLLKQNLDEIATQIVEKTLVDELKTNRKFISKSVNSMNLWIALKQYLNKQGDDEMKICNVQEECKKIYLECKKIENDEQYYFFAGQVAFYLLNKSKASKLTQDVTEPVIKANSVKRLKEEITYLYKKYNHEIYLNNPKFNNILSQLLINEPESNVKKNKDIILAGILANNVFYNKKLEEFKGNDLEENDYNE